MKKLKVCVTGASGFIGRKLVHSLSQQDYEINVLTRKDNSVFPTNINVIRGDLTSEDCPLEQFIGHCEIIFHCAGEINDTEVMRSLHIDGTQRLIQEVLTKAEQRGKPIHWVQLSSVGVYGSPQGDYNEERVVTEESPIHPKGVYEKTKAQSDCLVIKAAETGLITYTIVRPSNVFGADMPNQTLRSLVIFIRKGIFFYIGQPGSIATYVHVDDVVNLLMHCGFEAHAKGEVFNISNDCLFEEMIDGIVTTLNLKHPWLRLPESLARILVWVGALFVEIPLTQARINILVSRTRYPASKLKNRLNIIPTISVKSSISEVVLIK